VLVGKCVRDQLAGGVRLRLSEQHEGEAAGLEDGLLQPPWRSAARLQPLAGEALVLFGLGEMGAEGVGQG
jgi:hypothetical protein